MTQPPHRVRFLFLSLFICSSGLCSALHCLHENKRLKIKHRANNIIVKATLPPLSPDTASVNHYIFKSTRWTQKFVKRSHVSLALFRDADIHNNKLQKSLMWKITLCKMKLVTGRVMDKIVLWGHFSSMSDSLQPQIEVSLFFLFFLRVTKKKIRFVWRRVLTCISVAVVIGVYWCSTIYLNMIKKKGI